MPDDLALALASLDTALALAESRGATARELEPLRRVHARLSKPDAPSELPASARVRARPCPQCKAPAGQPCVGRVNGTWGPIPVHHSLRRSA